MKKIKHLMIWIGLLLSLVSCKDTMEAIGLGGDEIPAEGLVLNLQLTNFTKQQIGTRAGASETFNSLCAVFYGDKDKYLGKTDCYSTLSQQSDGSYKVKITNVPAGTKNVHLVANASDMTDDEAHDLQSLTAAKERDPQLDAPICWGEISIDKLLEANPSVTMLRQCAKISLEIDNSIQSNFTNAGLYVYTMATKAAIAPANYNTEQKTDDLAESTALRTEDNPLGGGTATTVAVNETSAGKAMVIIKANYKDSEGHDREGYYKVALYKDAKEKIQYALLRNHHYTIKVTKVNDYGFSTLEEAVRNDGLHFCVGTADITYLIPKLDGDQITKKDDKIKVEEENGKWKVSLTNTTANKNLWKASFTIKNQDGIEITYPVYHTGIFHKIDETSKVDNDYQLTENGDNEKKVKGWFYYGVVKVEGKKADETTTTYIPIIVIIHFIVYCRRVPLFY